MDVGDRIKSQREAKGWSQAQLGRLVGISQPAIKKIEDGDTQNSRFIARIAAALQLPLSELDPRLPADPPSSVIPAQHLLGQRDFPIHASAEGGPGQVIVSSDAVDWMPRPAPLAHVRGSYGLLISGTSMEPEYRPGDTALINPHLPIIGDEVYVFYGERVGEARATIKHLRRATPDQWHVTQWNPPEGSKRDFVLARREWQWAHRVLGKYARQ
jgi:phage repressor protein C with HTH and peptisase S24 domain